MIRYDQDFPAGVHSVFEVVQVENLNEVYALLQSHPYIVVNRVQVQAVEGHTDGPMNFTKTLFFCEWDR